MEGLKDLLWMSYRLGHVGLEVSPVFVADFALFCYFKQSQNAQKWALTVDEYVDICDQREASTYIPC